jgi:DNA repair exonuclease SbcCD ATPase subunit
MAATSAETARGAVAEAMATTHSAGHGASAPSGRDAAPRSDGDPAVALEAVWSKMEAVGQRFRNWDSRIDAVDSLLRERAEQRSRIERLAGDLRENRAALARGRQELDARIRAMARLEMEHQALLRDREALARALRDLQERHDALLQDRDFAIERVAVALRRLRP